jgi:hypothetical protein
MAEETDRLVDRLQRHIDRLEQVQLTGDNTELQQAVADLRDELDELKIIAPHIYGLAVKAPR